VGEAELREKPLPFSFKFIKNEFINTKEFTYCYLNNSVYFYTYFLLALKNLPEINADSWYFILVT